MPWGAAAGAAVSLFGSSKASKAAANEGKAQRKLQKEQMQFAKDQYQDYKDMYGGMEQGMIDEIEAYEPGEKLQTYLGESSADVSMAFDKRRGQTSREMGRFGIDPSQSRFDERQDELGREKALAEIGGRTSARRKSESDDDKNFARKLAAVSTGKEIPGQAGAVMGALSSGAAMHGRNAAQYGKQAAAGYGAAGQWAAKGINSYNSTPSTGVGGGSSGYMDAGQQGAGGSFMNTPGSDGSIPANYGGDNAWDNM